MVEKGGNFQFYIIIFIVSNLILLSICNKADEKETKNGKDEKWKKKNIRDYSEADLERLFDQWEVTCYNCYNLLPIRQSFFFISKVSKSENHKFRKSLYLDNDK